MVECPALPAVHGVALEAEMRESGGLMVGIIGIQVVLLVARPAIRRRAVVLAVDVALCTTD